jgi:hypothetical protein
VYHLIIEQQREVEALTHELIERVTQLKTWILVQASMANLEQNNGVDLRQTALKYIQDALVGTHSSNM